MRISGLPRLILTAKSRFCRDINYAAEHASATTLVSQHLPSIPRLAFSHPFLLFSHSHRLRPSAVTFSVAGYGSGTKKPPNSMAGCTLELWDTHTNTMFRSPWLDDAHLNHLLPHPVKFKLVWTQVGVECELGCACHISIHQRLVDLSCSVWELVLTIVSWCSQQRGAQQLYAWKAIPPSQDYVSLVSAI